MQYEDLNVMGKLLGAKICAIVSDRFDTLEQKVIGVMKHTHKDALIQKTKDRLFAYPQLLNNIKKYRLENQKSLASARLFCDYHYFI